MVTRRDVLSAGASLLAAGIATPRAGMSAAPARPNILWVVSEDNSPMIGAYGDKLAHTPVIDGLARRGLLYRRAYATAPVCAVSRFAILTGAFAQSCGPAHHMRAVAKHPAALQGYPEYLRKAGYYCTNNNKNDYNTDIDPHKIWNQCGSKAHWRSRPVGTPFMSVFNYMSTHESALNRPTAGKVKPEDVTVPPYLPDTPDIRTEISSYYNRIEIMDGEVGARLAELEADGLAEDTIVFYYSDHGGALPRSKHYCYEEGARACLIIAFPPKFAHMAPAPMGTAIETPVSFADLAPTVLAIAGIGTPAQMVGHSLLGRGSITPKRYVFTARDRMSERYDMTRTVTDGRYRYIRNYMPHRPWGQYMSNEWLNRGYQDWERQYRAGKLNPNQARFFESKPFEELYDTVSDVAELRNLADLAEHKNRLNDFRAVLDRHILDINDNGFIPEGSPIEGYASSRAPGAYPLARTMELASKAARRDVHQVGAFQRKLTDDNEVIRYWAAQGLLMLGRQAMPARAALRISLEKDTSPHVRVVAAEALAGLGEPNDAVSVLADLVDRHPIYPVRLQAINALTYVDPRAAKAALPAIERAAREDNPPDWSVRAAARYLSAVLRGQYHPAYPAFDMQWFIHWIRDLKPAVFKDRVCE